jgi:hypothetical protein
LEQRSHWLLAARSALGVLFALISLAFATLAFLLWSRRYATGSVAFGIALASLAVFAFAIQLMRTPDVPSDRASEPRFGALFASALPLTWALATLIAIAGHAMGQRWTPGDLLSLRGEGTLLPFLLYLIPLVLELHLFAHELGHLAAGRLAGFHPRSLRTGLLHITWLRRPRLRTQLNRDPRFLLHGRTEFEARSDASIAETSFMLLGGVLVNALICAGATQSLFLTDVEQHTGRGLALLMLAVVGFEMAATNLIPFQVRSLRAESDGSQLLRQWRLAKQSSEPVA